MRALEFMSGHVIYNLAYTFKLQLKTTLGDRQATSLEKSSNLLFGAIPWSLCGSRSGLWTLLRYVTPHFFHFLSKCLLCIIFN